MERAQPLHAFDHAADQIADALFHLARSLVRERDGEHLARPGAARGEDVGEAGGQHARLARARSRQNQHRPIDRQHGFALLRIEPRQIRRLARNRHRVRSFLERGVKGIAIAVAETAHGKCLDFGGHGASLGCCSVPVMYGAIRAIPAQVP